jgi:myo-inositol-1(or 4)-monophosphatase
LEPPLTGREAAFLHDVCREAGALTLRYFGRVSGWTEKSGRGDIVTEADHAVEELVARRLAEELPGHSLLTEERGFVPGHQDAPIWVLDPVDGTRNFALGVPVYCVSLACVAGGKILLGAVYDPVHDILYHAESGKGAFQNEVPVRVSETPDLHDALISVSWSPRRRDVEEYVRIVARVATHTSYFRRIGSAALVLSYVATGRFDGYIQAGISPWDIAAGTLLVREAGGVVTDIQGCPFDILTPSLDIVAGNPAVHRCLMEDVLRKS